MTVFLCGFMGCGKSASGQLAAKKLGLSYFDTDEIIVQNEKRTIPQIFAESGEPYFRRTEAETVKSLTGRSAVVSCGGGAMLNAETAAYVRENGGLVIFLDVPFEVCYERIRFDANRPIAASSDEDSLRERFNARHEIYIKNSDIIVNGIGSPVEVAGLIADEIKKSK